MKTESTLDQAVAAVIVAYRPTFGLLEKLVTTLSQQVTHIYIVDNSDADDSRVATWFADNVYPRASLISMGANRGVGSALNAGIRRARTAHATHVLLSDQDSLPDANMVSGLMRAIATLNDRPKVAAMGPAFVDCNTGTAYSFQHRRPGKFWYRHARPTATSPVIETLSLITSGCIVSIAALNDIGDMREDFFIDYIDTEWCQRARARGWHLYSTSLARMTHRVGDDALRVWFFGWRNESSYSALRVYYRTRNFVALCRLHYVPARWKIRGAWYWLGTMYAQGFYGHDKLHTWQMIARGARDGLLNRMGPYGHLVE